MEALVHAMLSNALAAAGLALIPAVLTRAGRSPALVHSLWLLVLLKLVTPPLVTLPFQLPVSAPWSVVPSTWPQSGFAADTPTLTLPHKGGGDYQEGPLPWHPTPSRR